MPQFLLLLLSSALGESWVVWVDSAWHCMSPHLQHAIIPGICELLPLLHHGLFTADPPTDEFVQEGHTLEFRQEGSNCILNFEECILHSPSTLPLGPSVSRITGVEQHQNPSYECIK